MNNELIKQFKKAFSYTGNHLELRSPGRVNLIGEHTDYNDGFVFPAAVDLEIKGIAQPRKDNMVNVYSLDYQEQESFDLTKIKKEGTSWINYIKGVARELQAIIDLETGADIVYQSNLPPNSGLSSSAAFEVINALLLTHVNNQKLSKKKIALLCQRAENTFIGVNCGIMDQFAVTLCQKDTALFIDTKTLEYESVPLDLGPYQILIANTNKPRSLTDSAYNQRRWECEQAVSALTKFNPDLQSLRDVEISFLMDHQKQLDPLVFNRARHVIEENQRVKSSIQALQNNDLIQFGRLMNASHQSLRELYQVSCKELDTLVIEARKMKGVLGSRMTGAGFGGCTVTLIHQDYTDEFMNQVGFAYEKQTGLKADFYLTGAAQGASFSHLPEDQI